MTILEAITLLSDIKPHQYSEAVVVGWLSHLDMLLYSEVIRNYEGAEEIQHGPYSPDSDMDTKLMVPDPYSDVYIQYAAAQVDYFNGEYDRYNNSMVMYNMAISHFYDHWNRTHMPKQDNFVRF